MTDAEAIELAKPHNESINGLMAMIGDRRSLTKPEKNAVQARFKKVKAALERDRKLLRELPGKLTPCVLMLRSEIEQTGALLSPIRTNTDPFEVDWHGTLYEATIKLNFFLDDSGAE